MASALKWLSYKTKQAKLFTYPDRMYLESTNICNLSCIMCPTGLKQMRRAKGLMDFELFKQIVDEMASHVQTTTLHIWGEPLLHPRLVDMVRYCRQKDLRSEISTNATLLNEEKARQILEAGPRAVYLCLDGTTEETYERIRRRADFETTRENIARFIRLRSEGNYDGMWVNLQIVEMKPTVAEIEEFRRMWSIPGVDRINVKAFDSWGGQLDEVSQLGEGEPDVPARRWHCPNLWYHVHIYWDGTLVCCDRDFDALYPLGNVSNGVMRAWNGPRMVELRRKHVEGRLQDVPSCSKCVEWTWWQPTPLSSWGNSPQDKNRKD